MTMEKRNLHGKAQEHVTPARIALLARDVLQPDLAVGDELAGLVSDVDPP
jgi:hypothetical protein